MKIDIEGFTGSMPSMEIKTGITGKSMDAASFADIVQFGHSGDDVTGGQTVRKSILNNADCTIESLKTKAAVLKDNLGAIFNKMGTGSIVEMDKEGVDINNTDSHKLVTIVEQIQIKLAAYCDDFEATADIDAEEVSETLGAGAAAYKIAESFNKNAVKPTKENVSQVLGALDKADKIGTVGDDIKAFMLQNKMEPTINNVYVAANSGYVSKKGTITEMQWQELEPQVARIITDAGIAADEETLQNGRWMIENEIDVTAENFRRLEELDKVSETFDTDSLIDRITAAMTDGYKAGDTFLTEEEYSWEKAVRAVNTVHTANDDQIMAWVHSDRPYTLEGLKDTADSGESLKYDKADYKYVKAARQLAQIRLMMTIESAGIMEKTGVSVNTTDISELIEEMKRTEAVLLGEQPEFDEVTLEDVGRVNEVFDLFDKLSRVPSAVIGNVICENREPSAIAMLGCKAVVNARISEAGDAYEALSTEIRSDLGDSVSKAVKASTGDILSGMGYEDSEENRRAVRILAYNSMEMNEKNIDSVKSIDYSVNQLFKNMTPKAVLQMIRDGINPLETDVTELNSYLNEAVQSDALNVEKYSEFLYRLDKKGSITEDERKKYIGIYRMVTRFQKDGMKACGSLVKQGLPLTMGNLLTAYMTGKNSGIELTADDETELVSVKDKITYYKNLFGEVKNKITPESIESVADGLDDMTPEQFAEGVRNVQIYEADPAYERYEQNAWQAAHMPEEVYKFITENGIPATYNNLMAARTLLKRNGSFFDGYREETADEGIEKRIIEKLDNKKELQAEYDDILKNTGKAVIKALESEESSVRMEELKNLGYKMSLIAGLSKQNNYYIPYQNDGEPGLINLRVIEDGENTGSFSIRMFNEKRGRITVDAKVTADSVSAHIMCESVQEVRDMEKREEKIKNRLRACSFNVITVSVNMVKTQPEYGNSDMEDVSTGRIFTAAKIFVQELAN